MLQVIRDRAQGIVVWVIVGLIIITFALFGLSSYLSGSAKVNVASVNGVEISQSDFLGAYQNYQDRLQQMLGKSYSPDMFDDKLVRKQVLDGLVTREVLTQHLASGGFSASPQQVLQRITGMSSFFDETGKFSSEQYKRTLSLQGMNSVMFEQRIAQDIADQQLYAGLAHSAFITPSQSDAYTRLQAQRRDVSYLQVNHDSYLASVTVSDEEVEQFYKENSEQFITPEMVSIEYLELDLNKVAAREQVDSSEIKSYYEQNIRQYQSEPEQRRASHILITIDSKTDDAAARKKADELYERLDKGEDFSSLAKEYSADPGSAQKGGDLGYFGKGVMDKAFEDSVFALKKGEVSKPVKSAFGYHIIKLEDIKAGKMIPLDEVSDKIKKDIQLQKAEQQFYADIEKLNNLTYETPDSLQPAADELGLSVQTSAMFTRQGGQGILANPAIINAAFSEEVLNQGKNSEMLELSDTHLVVLRNKEHKPSAPLELAQVKARIVQSLKQQKAIEKSKQRATELFEKLQQGTSAADVAKTDKSVQLHKPGLISRTTDPDEVAVSGEIRQAVFSMPKPTGKPSLHQMALFNGDQAIVILNKVVDGEVLADDQKQQLLSMYGNASYDSYIDYLKSNADIELFTENIAEK